MYEPFMIRDLVRINSGAFYSQSLQLYILSKSHVTIQ